MKLKNIRYFGRFYEFEGELGWMPLHKVIFIYLMGYGYSIDWVSQKNVRFD